jgi:hypothetical protein
LLPGIVERLENSLRRLRGIIDSIRLTGRIRTPLYHAEDPSDWPGNFSSALMEELRKVASLDTAQPPYNPLERVMIVVACAIDLLLGAGIGRMSLSLLSYYLLLRGAY